MGHVEVSIITWKTSKFDCSVDCMWVRSQVNVILDFAYGRLYRFLCHGSLPLLWYYSSQRLEQYCRVDSVQWLLLTCLGKMCTSKGRIATKQRITHTHTKDTPEFIYFDVLSTPSLSEKDIKIRGCHSMRRGRKCPEFQFRAAPVTKYTAQTA